MMEYDVAVIGAGPGGLAAALEAKRRGAERVILIERDTELGGILPQCIHNGFGSVLFEKDFPGPLYAQRFIDELKETDIEVLTDTMVMYITGSKKIYTSSREGYREFSARAIVLAMGCRERTRSQIRIPGSRPAGVFTAGTVQRLVNIEGYMPGRRFVILGSGDIGMIMARRLTIEGAEVVRVVEAMPFLTGLRRNYVQCLEDYNIPLVLQHTVKRITGRERVEGVEIVKIDEQFRYIPGTEELIPCDALLFSVGLIPENELSLKAGVELDPITGGPVVNERMETSVEGIFAAGNVVTIYDLVDYVSTSGFTAGRNAAFYAAGKGSPKGPGVIISPGENIHSLIPQQMQPDWEEDLLLRFRVKKNFETSVRIEFLSGDNVVHFFKERYARPAEMIIKKIPKKRLLNLLPEDCRKITVRAVEQGGEDG